MQRIGMQPTGRQRTGIGLRGHLAGLVLPLVLLAAGAAAGAGANALATNGCVPTGELRGDADRGAGLHQRHCAQCHGADGRAEVMALQMETPPRDQSDAAYMKTVSDADLYVIICRGGAAMDRSPVMPAWGDVFTDGQIRDLIAYVRTFSGT